MIRLVVSLETSKGPVCFVTFEGRKDMLISYLVREDDILCLLESEREARRLR